MLSSVAGASCSGTDDEDCCIYTSSDDAEQQERGALAVVVKNKVATVNNNSYYCCKTVVKLCLGLLVLEICSVILFTDTGVDNVAAGKRGAVLPLDPSNAPKAVVVEQGPASSEVNKIEEVQEEIPADSVVSIEAAAAASEAIGDASVDERPPKVESRTEMRGDLKGLRYIGSEKTKTEPETQVQSEEEASPHEQVANPADEPDNYTMFADEAPKVLYSNLRYRRLCANVGISSILCMTIRFPFEVPEQDPNYSYPRPFNRDYYKLNKSNGIQIIDGDKLESCKNAAANMSIEDAVKQCLEANSSDEEFRGAAVWTRRGKDGTTRLYRTASPEQIKRNLGIFEKDEMVIVGGASRMPGVFRCMLPLFGKCRRNGVVHKVRGGGYYCEHERRRLTYGYAYMNETEFYIGGNDVHYFAPTDLAHSRGTHGIPELSAAALLTLQRAEGWTKLKPFSIVVDYAWAHSQNHEMLTNEWERVEYIMKGFPAYIMQLASPAGKKELAELGFELKRIIVFDGSPQTFPSETGGYVPHGRKFKDEGMFVENNGYPGWYPELGTACQGPLPPNSKSKEAMMMARQAFADLGLEMQWYGRTWEFANQFWYQTNTWDHRGKGGLDCTHSYQKGSNNGYACVNRWFFQAMVDDLYEHQQ